MAEQAQVFDDLFQQILDCIIELRSRELNARTALQKANDKISRYEEILSEKPRGLKIKNTRLQAEIEQARKEIADLRAQLGTAKESRPNY